MGQIWENLFQTILSLILGEENLEGCFGKKIGADLERVDFSDNKFQECASLANTENELAIPNNIL